MNLLVLSMAAVASLAIPLAGARAQMTSQTTTHATTTHTTVTPATYKGHGLAAKATVSIDAARAIAMKTRGGVMTDQELEKEAGGSGLRYSFDIKSGGHTYEVGVDAMTGKVLENKAEGKNPD